MSLHPEALKKAQNELDTFVGRNRLPDFNDEPSLVYLKALIKETLRWRPILPVSLTHCTTDDDELHGYFIPAGTTLVPNVWYVGELSRVHHELMACRLMMTYQVNHA